MYVWPRLIIQQMLTNDIMDGVTETMEIIKLRCNIGRLILGLY